MRSIYGSRFVLQKIVDLKEGRESNSGAAGRVAGVCNR